MLLDFTIGRKGLLGYLKALGGSNIVKVIPEGGDASETQVIAIRLKVVCGSNTSYLEDMAFIFSLFNHGVIYVQSWLNLDGENE